MIRTGGWAVIPVAALCLAPVAQADDPLADPPALRGEYLLTFHTDQKTGTSVTCSRFPGHRF